MDRAGSVKRSSVRLSVCAIISPPRATAAGLLLWAQRYWSIVARPVLGRKCKRCHIVSLRAKLNRDFFRQSFWGYHSGSCAFWCLQPLLTNCQSPTLSIEINQLRFRDFVPTKRLVIFWLTFEIWQFQSKLSLPLLVISLILYFCFKHYSKLLSVVTILSYI